MFGGTGLRLFQDTSRSKSVNESIFNPAIFFHVQKKDKKNPLNEENTNSFIELSITAHNFHTVYKFESAVPWESSGPLASMADKHRKFSWVCSSIKYQSFLECNTSFYKISP